MFIFDEWHGDSHSKWERMDELYFPTNAELQRSLKNLPQSGGFIY